MNDREQQVIAARRMISDERLEAFFRAIRGGRHLLAVELINEHLDKGGPLDASFYTGGEYGFLLCVTQKSESSFGICFGCQAGPLAGDGGEWLVTFDGDAVRSVSGVGYWLS